MYDYELKAACVLSARIMQKLYIFLYMLRDFNVKLHFMWWVSTKKYARRRDTARLLQGNPENIMISYYAFKSRLIYDESSKFVIFISGEIFALTEQIYLCYHDHVIECVKPANDAAV